MLRPKPVCPTHPDSTVSFDGTYGRPPHKRQRYKCRPICGGFIHRFTEPLPRQMTASGECIECERGLHAHEGPPTPRQFDFTAREVAFALIWAGSGKPWREVGYLVRQRAERLKLSGKGFVLPNRDGNTIADWIELFAPTIFARYEPRRWPRILAVDAAPFKTTTLNKKGLPKAGGAHAFHVFAAYGWDDKYQDGYVVSMRAQPGFGFNQGTLYWANFFEYLKLRLGPGMPEQIICDADQDIRLAIDLVWPSSQGAGPVVFICHWHLKHRLLKLLRAEGLLGSDSLYLAAESALSWKAKWDEFLLAYASHGTPFKKIDNWIKSWETQIGFQLTHQADRLVSIGPLEQVLGFVGASLNDRRGTFGNRERLNRLLMLMQLHRNKQAREQTYAKIIREELLKNDGKSEPRRQILDPKSLPSLRI